MIGPRTVRLSALAAASALLVLGTPSPASAQCAAPTYHGGLPLRVGQCPEGVAGGAAAGVWALLVLAAGLWLASALSRSRTTTDADLAAIDEVFSQAAADGPTEAEEDGEDSGGAESAPTSPSTEGGR
ncbi:hypothetical protein ADK57_45875 [Streptomyces sp. MMG1533]|uniref:hypothetical protein n=1 Tax=Streptomyces sp. MMG1533 TaxID=1415546 RepID=UPI0006AE551D|nr:hypothetical protein [Streptomyces sp. MMG1533]KOU55071.1 hypothetical protein ADK57_45875 [Streptomyces sp. MMG1533]